MAITNARLVAASLTGSLATQYTVPATTQVTVTSITLANTGSAARSCTVKIAGKTLIPATAVEGHEIFGVTVGHVLEAGELIEAQQDTGTDVDLIISGVVEDL